MAHIKLEELYGMCNCCYGTPCSEECNPNAEWCKNDGIFSECSQWEPRIRFIERSYKRFTAEEHDATYDGLFGYWDFTANGKTRECSYLEIDGHVYCDERRVD